MKTITYTPIYKETIINDFIIYEEYYRTESKLIEKFFNRRLKDSKEFNFIKDDKEMFFINF